MDTTENVASALSHDDLLEITKSSLCTILSCDHLLSDLPSDIILEEVLSQIAVEHGQAITVILSREEQTPLKIIVPQNASVRDLKKAIARHFEIHQKRTGNKVKISWKYIWRTYDLEFDSIVLDDDSSSIDLYGVTNRVIITFKKKLKKKK